MGAKILSNSWGGGGESALLKEAIQRSHAAGTLFVAAAGNDSNNNDSNPTYPATYDVPNVLSVAALDNKGQIASFSNYGKRKVHVAAPGVNILSTTQTGYDSWSGTSMAAPHVSGIAVLLASENPKMSGVEMKERIISTSSPVTGMKSKVSSGGIAHAYNSLTNVLPQPDPNDPSNWKSISVSVSSAHPYKDKTNETFEVSVPGAKEISIYFSKFSTERVFDKLEIYDGAGTLIETLSGDNDDYFSATITGSKAKLIFQSDDSVTKYGFDITRLAYR
jgi:subtilisin family serine protease